MAKKIIVSERDSKAAEDALSELEDTEGTRIGASTGEQLRDTLRRLRGLLSKAARPRLSKPLRPH